VYTNVWTETKAVNMYIPIKILIKHAEENVMHKCASLKKHIPTRKQT
jgi:hypothetical protein